MGGLGVAIRRPPTSDVRIPACEFLCRYEITTERFKGRIRLLPISGKSCKLGGIIPFHSFRQRQEFLRWVFFKNSKRLRCAAT